MGPSGEVQPEPEPSIPAQVLAELRAAGEARALLLREEEAWALEKEKLEILRRSLLDRAARLRATAEEARREEAALRERAQEERLERLEEALDAAGERLEKDLAALAESALPGLVPPDRAEGITEPIERLAAAVRRLEDAEKEAGKSSIEIVTGRLEDRAVTVRLLRIGGVAACWVSLDGEQAGTAATEAGSLVLSPETRPDDIEAIRKAVAIAEGRAAPDWVLLPAGKLRLKN